MILVTHGIGEGLNKGKGRKNECRGKEGEKKGKRRQCDDNLSTGKWGT